MKQVFQDQKDQDLAFMRAHARQANLLIRDAMKSYGELVSEELIKIRAERIQKQTEQNAAAAYAAAAARGVQNTGAPTFTDPMAGAVQAAAVVMANNAPPTAPPKRQSAVSLSFDYLVETFKAGQYSTAKDFYRALERKAGAGSPFDKGTGANAGSLFVRDIGKPLAFHTLQNHLPKIRKAVKMG